MDKIKYIIRETLYIFQPIVVSKDVGDTSNICIVESTFKGDIPKGTQVQVSNPLVDLLTMDRAKYLLEIELGRLLNFVSNEKDFND